MENENAVLWKINDSVAKAVSGTLPVSEALRLISSDIEGADFHVGEAPVVEYLPSATPPAIVGDMPSGIPVLDRHLGGGLCNGELAYVSAGSGYGKTTFLISRGGYVLANTSGKVVTHCTYEIYSDTVAQRYTEYLKAEPIDCITSQDMKELDSTLKSRLYIANMVGRSDIADLRVVVERTEPHLLIVDYGDLVHVKSDKRFSELGLVWEKLRELGETYGCSVWTASRLNRDGTDSESYLKSYNADLHVTLHVTPEGVSRNTGNLVINKIRRKSGLGESIDVVYMPEVAYIG